ncbi:MAG: 3-hydroxyacyl-CoA dehydrogenase NAD-binding domain-containing protein [Candidatus Nanopelagicales bacterium]|jgi:3-hydroxyacyl-CoA dehydrogenase|tara:strand:- start:18714 stop:20738 length:2025 start_codon:yes stop_codon:yes gene_type:complete
MPVITSSTIGKVAVLTIDNPPVNMGNTAVRGELYRAILALHDAPDIEAVVINAAGSNFYAGSDISEFDHPLQEPQLPTVINAIEALPIPVVAAITGLALGGGLELALGCDARVGDETARVGFPEVLLGLIPGAGGTVRSARLVGIPTAIDLVASARQLNAEKALELGILNLVVDSTELLEAACAFALAMGRKARIRDMVVPSADQADIDRAEAVFTVKKQRPNVLAAIKMVRDAAGMDAQNALDEERRIFNHFRLGEESSNLRYLFFAKRAAAKALRSTGGKVTVRRVGVAGAGTMGLSLARAFSVKGFDVIIFDTNLDALLRAKNELPDVATTTDLAGFADVDLVIEAVFEDMAVKKNLLSQIETQVRDDTVLASNTSYLDLEEMSSDLVRPQRFAGMHFFNPADRNPLVELIRTKATEDTTMGTLSGLSARLGKIAIPAGIDDGFIANRVYADYRAQAEFLLEDGASVQQVDEAMVALGMAIGPFAVTDMSGLDIAWARRKRLADTRDANQRYVHIADSLCELNRLGKKTGSGWYDYPEGAKRGVADSEVAAIIAQARQAKAIIARDISDTEIQLRILGSMLVAAAVLVESGIAQRASDIDLALTEGFAFPKWLGGPLRLLSRYPETTVLDGLAAVYNSCPVTFAMAEGATRGQIPQELARVLSMVAPPVSV